jgi:acyl carrier protein
MINTRDDIVRLLQSAISEVIVVPVEELDPTEDLTGYEIDSMSWAEIVLMVQEAIQTKIELEEFRGITTIDEAAAVLERALALTP